MAAQHLASKGHAIVNHLPHASFDKSRIAIGRNTATTYLEMTLSLDGLRSLALLGIFKPVGTGRVLLHSLGALLASSLAERRLQEIRVVARHRGQRLSKS